MRILLLTVLFLFSATLKAQVFPARQYTTADELANSNVYDISHDEKGYLWFATERGLSRFDGYKFTNYLFKEGLEGAMVYGLAQDKKQHLFAATRQDGIYRLNGNFTKIIQDNARLANEQIAIAGNYLYSLDDNRMVAAVHLTSQEISVVFPSSDIAPYSVQSGSGDTVFIGTSKGIYYSVKGKQAKRYADFDFPCYSIYVSKGKLYVGSDSKVYYIHKKQPEEIAKVDTPLSIKRLLVDSDGNVWCAGFPQNTLLYISKGRVTDLSNSLNINGISINKILEDHEGNIWIATYGKGVFCLHHRYIANYTARDGLSNEYITSLLTFDNGVFIGTYDGLHVLHDEKITQYKFFPGQLEYIRGMEIDNHTCYINISGIKADRVDIKRSNISGMPVQFLHVPSSYIQGNTAYFNHWSASIYRADVSDEGLSRTEVWYNDTDAHWKRANAFLYDNTGRLWVGTSRGVLVLNNQVVEQRCDTGFLYTNINCFLQGADGEIYVGCDNGLAVYQQGKWRFHRELMGKSVENITGLTYDADKRIWMSTLNGLYLIEDGNLIQFDARNTLLSDEINAIAYDARQNAIWIGTTFGLSKIDVSMFDKTPVRAPAAIFKTLRAADSIYRDLGVDSRLELPYTSKNLIVRFSAIQFSAPEGIKFYYTFDGGEWEPTVGRQIEFASIPYGEHTIELKSVGERGVEGPVARLTIFVATPFWATTWFKGLIGLMIALLAYMVLRKRFEVLRKKQQERLELQSKVAELRHQALAASMNPHFIFNALNSIQHFINAHNTEEATDYLGKFARLIRMMLDYGGRTYIPLKDELERLEYYLELEKVRFGDKLNYTIEVDPELRNSPVEIPNMIIQPIVENALWHGILPANRPGHLQLKFTRINGTIGVTVQDDGIGIEESRRRKKSGHNSLGIQMIHERLELLNRLSGYKASLSIRDRSTISATEHGTLAEIRFI